MKPNRSLVMQTAKSLNPKPKSQTLAEEDTLEKDKPLLNQGQVAVLETLDELASGKTVTPTTGEEGPPISLNTQKRIRVF
jgi:hypothetical protein